MDGAKIDKRERGEEEDAMTMLAAMLLRWGAGGQRHEVSRWRIVLLHGGGGGQQCQVMRAGVR